MEQMMITRLYLRNFIPIKAVHHKKEIDLIFPKDKMINLFYGDMGSCKTFILGHLQPWHNFGTLDVRNMDKFVEEDEDATKVIEYDKGPNHYVIRHDYFSGGKTIKHFVSKNGEELNVNGNLRTFNDIISIEFGIEPEMLKLIRIGDNVSNLIRLNAVERKKLVALLQKGQDYYLYLFKKLTADYRTMNAQLTGLSQRLASLEYDKEAQFEDDLDALKVQIIDAKKEYETLVFNIAQLNASITTALNGMDVNQYKERLESLRVTLAQKKSEYDRLSEDISSAKDLPSTLDLAREIGALDGNIATLNNDVVKLEKEYEEKSIELNKLKDIQQVSQNTNHLNELRITFEDLRKSSLQLQTDLTGYKLDVSESQLIRINSDFEEFSRLVEELYAYDTDMISKVFLSDASILNWAKNKIDILIRTKAKKQRDANNIKFSATYSSPDGMFIPPLCPTKDCPFRQSHPFTLQKATKDTSVDDYIMQFKNEMDSLDREIDVYSEYSTVYSKVTQLKSMWENLEPQAKKLGVLKCEKLLLILTDMRCREWYNAPKMISIIDLANKQQRLYQLNESLKRVKDEIAQLEINSDSDIDKKILQLEKDISSCVDSLRKTQDSINSSTEELKNLNDSYIKVSNMEIMIQDANVLESEIKSIETDINNAITTLKMVEDAVVALDKATDRKIDIVNGMEVLQKRAEALTYKLKDIDRTKEEYGQILEEKELINDILEASSPKSGIPLVAVEMFLNDARDDINDLISEIDDDFEIAKFVIDDDTFQIPYIANGKLVSDVSKASQGEKSIVNIAIPFALLCNSGIGYNIMLLDEVDAPLHETQRNLFPSILFKQMKKINSCQVFMISHNWTYDGYPVNIILTSDEHLAETELRSITKV